MQVNWIGILRRQEGMIRPPDIRREANFLSGQIVPNQKERIE